MKRLALVVAIAVVLLEFVGPVGLWPWDHDEVHSLMELGRIPIDRYPGPRAQLERMHLLVPVWSGMQNAVLSVLPANEWGSRLMPSLAGALAVIVAFIGALRISGWWGWSLLVLTMGSQPLLWLSQQGRFYPVGLLWLTVSLACVWNPDTRRRHDVLAILAAVAAVLSHNLTLVIFGLGAAAAVPCWALGWMPRSAARRAALSAAAVVGIYALYLRPMLTGWTSGGTGGTSPIVSFVAQVGIAPLALAAFGAIAILRDRAQAALRWWVAVLLMGLMFVALAGQILGNWNPRYGVFFMVPVWVVAAAGTAIIAEALAPRRLAAAWLATVVLILMPKMASHFIDGSRHDFRTAARAVAQASPDLPVLCNWPATLQYYLDPITGQQPTYWAPGDRLPDEGVVVVFASNAWDAVLQFPGRQTTIVAQVGRRRLDEQSHLVRVYRVDPK